MSSFHSAKFKKTLRVDPELWGCAIFGSKMAHLPWTIFFGTNYCYYFHLPIDPFHCAKFKKILKADLELWRCTISGSKMVHFPQANFFLENYFYHFHLPIGLFHFSKLKKNPSSRSRVMTMCNFWAQNGPFPQMRIFFRKPVNEPCFFHSCLSTCQKSKSDFNLLVKYWWLKNIEMS